MDILDKLNTKELLLEVQYLKATIASEIKMKKRIKNEETGKFQMITFSRDVLITSIKNVIKPDDDAGKDSVEILLEKVFQNK